MNRTIQPPKTPMLHLLWKDERIIRPAAILGIVTILGLNLIALAICDLDSYTYELAFGVSMFACFGVTGLMAFAGGPFLISGEQESGTQNWLRSLPVSWKRVLISKLLVTFGWTAALGALSLCIFLILNSLGIFDNLTYGASEDPPLSAIVPITALWMTVVILVSMISSYVIRSGLGALIFAFVASFVVLIAAGLAMDSLFGSRLEGVEYFWISIFGIVFYASLLLLLFAVAKRRLNSAAPAGLVRQSVRSLHRQVESQTLGSTYRPSNLVSLKRPSAIKALIWQQHRQTFWIALPILLCCIAGTIAANAYQGMDAASGFLTLAWSMVPFATSALGVLAFYGDAKNGQAKFFADRGIAPRTIWITRVAMSAAYAVIACLIVSFLPEPILAPPVDRSLLAAIWWACGVLVGKNVSRPALAFLAAPSVSSFASTFIFVLLYQYPGFLWLGYLSAAIILFASWRSLPSFLNRNRTWRNAVSSFGYLAIAALFPAVMTLGWRWATIPSANGDLQSLISQIDALENPPSNVLGTKRYSNVFRQADQDKDLSAADDLIDRLKRELDAKNLGELTSLNELEAWYSEKELLGNHLTSGASANGMTDRSLGMELKELAALHDVDTGYPETELHRQLRTSGKFDNGITDRSQQMQINELAVQVLLRWSHRVRTDAINAETRLTGLMDVGERSEALAVNLLHFRRAAFRSEERWKELVQMIPDKEVRKRSRLVALAREWKAFSGNDTHYFSKIKIRRKQRLTLGIEHTRAVREVECGVGLAIDQIESGKNFSDQRERVKLVNHWFNAATAGRYKPSQNFTLTSEGIEIDKGSKYHVIDRLSKFLNWQLDLSSRELRIQALNEDAK